MSKAFRPELAIVTIGGGEKLEEPLVVRPTSETVIGYMYSKWIKSYRDLPVLINQWGNVVRWELRTRLFLRTLEFYWQEGHTAHATAEEAEAETRAMLDVYADFAINDAAIPVIPGRKTDAEKFAGADAALLHRSHDGRYARRCNPAPRTTSVRISPRPLTSNTWTRTTNSSSAGPPPGAFHAFHRRHHHDPRRRPGPDPAAQLAPIQVVIVPIYKNDAEKSVGHAGGRSRPPAVEAPSASRSTTATELTPGFKFNDWELRGVPLRIEMGPKDVEKGTVVLARRDCPAKPGKTFVPQTQLAARSPKRWPPSIPPCSSAPGLPRCQHPRSQRL